MLSACGWVPPANLERYLRSYKYGDKDFYGMVRKCWSFAATQFLKQYVANGSGARWAVKQWNSTGFTVQRRFLTLKYGIVDDNSKHPLKIKIKNVFSCRKQRISIQNAAVKKKMWKTKEKSFSIPALLMPAQRGKKSPALLVIMRA